MTSHIGLLRLAATAPGQPELIINNTAAGLGTDPTGIGDVKITWSRASARDHADPSTMVAQVITTSATEPALQFGAEVTLAGAAAFSSGYGDQFPLFRGWIDKTKISRRKQRDLTTGAWTTTWVHTITVGDIVGRAAATKIGDTPWPEQYLVDRLPTIEAASPFPLIDFTAIWWSGGRLCAARDVDNLQLSEALEKAAGTSFYWVHDGPNGVQLLTFPIQALADMWGMTHGRQGDHPDELLQVPAAHLTDADRTIDRQAVVNQARIEYVSGVVGNPARTEASQVLRDIRPGQSTAELVMSSDLVDLWAGQGRSGMISWAESLFSLTQDPVAVLDKVQLLLGRTDAHTLERLTSLWYRSNAVVKITDAPADVYPYQHVIGGELVLSGAGGTEPTGPDPDERGYLSAPSRQSLTLTLAPTLLAGQRPLEIGDFPTVPWVSGYQSATIEYANAAIEDTELSTLPWDGAIT